MSELGTFPLTRECFVTPVALAAIRKFGFESLEWEPEILTEAFEQAFEITKLPQKLADKLQCGYMLIGTNAFNASIEGFLSATYIMNNLVFDELDAPYCSLEMCAWSVWEYLQLLGDIKDGKPAVEFCSDIKKYIQEVGKVNGVYQFPKWLSFADYDKDEVPDNSSDPEQFSMFQTRQSNYVSDLNGFVTEKQAFLKEELITLNKSGIIA